MKPSLLVLVQGYPGPGDRYNMAYVHTRLLQYAAAGWPLRVLNFGTRTDYVFEGIEVLSEAGWRRADKEADLLISHAPNLRNHLRFLLGPGSRIPRWLFFFHGHEVLKKSAYYPPPYPFARRHGQIWQAADAVYDRLKLAIWHQFLPGLLYGGRLEMVFVSEWMRQAFLACVPIAPQLVTPHSTVIPNGIHPCFLSQRWQGEPAEPLADFVTIRPLDQPKYAVDQVRDLAEAHPRLRFDVYGRGEFFRHYPPPPNLRWFDRFLQPEEMPALLQRYRAALMPTRLDAQGVMMCELASFDMPVITSDLPICREMLAGFPRVGYFGPETDLETLLQSCLSAPAAPDRRRFAAEATIARELELIERLLAAG